jgi:membrane protein DedA with SNARE-associated domain
MPRRTPLGETMIHFLSFSETQLALSIFLFSFVYEDGATLLAATLGAAGRLDSRLGFASAFLGIWIGDMGLYFVGSVVGRRVSAMGWVTRMVSQHSLNKAEAWFRQRGPLTIVMSRFIPGSRLPLYFAAGALKLPAKLFGAITGMCSAVWVAVIFAIWHFTPGLPISFENRGPWVFVVVMLLAPWLLSKSAPRLWRKFRLAWRKYRRWEFWPAWMFYPPVVAMCIWLGLRYRGFSLPTIANPSFRNGGIVGESKIEVQQALMGIAPDLVSEAYLIEAGEFQQRCGIVESLRWQHSIDYPFVLKPNIGQRGAGFKLVSSAIETEQYLRQVQSDVILQRYAPDPKEVGVFYYRFPGQARGHIFAVTEKVFPVMVGDGTRTLEELIGSDERASLIAKVYLDRFPEDRVRVLEVGERIRLVEAGNHCQGCIFRDGSHLISEPLGGRIDEISRRLPGFFIGRYDIRYTNDGDLARGENFKIIELNGAASEATNIYDERNSLWSAYRTLYRQWQLVFAIGHANRDMGCKPASALDVLKDWNVYRMVSAAYPAAD